VTDTSDDSRSPQTGKFQKGHSGNPKGRPRKPAVSDTRSAFEIIIKKRVTITEGDVERELSVEEALQHRTFQNALEGDRAAQRVVLKWIIKRENAIGRTGQLFLPPRTVKFRERQPRNADDAMWLLGIVGPNTSKEYYAGLLLEPWAVQAALARRRGGKSLTPQEVEEIKRDTRADETLRWPRRIEKR
jgi:hypothetical protein